MKVALLVMMSIFIMALRIEIITPASAFIDISMLLLLPLLLACRTSNYVHKIMSRSEEI